MMHVAPKTVISKDRAERIAKGHACESCGDEFSEAMPDHRRWRDAEPDQLRRQRVLDDEQRGLGQNGRADRLAMSVIGCCGE